MNPAVGIRPATAGDLDAVECVERRSFPEGEAFTRRQLRYLLPLSRWPGGSDCFK